MDFPGGPAVETLNFQCISNAEGEGSIHGWGTRIPHFGWLSQKLIIT